MIKNVFCKPVYTVKIVWPALIIFICIFIRKEKRISVALFFFKVYWTRNSDLNVKNTPKARKTLFAVFKEKRFESLTRVLVKCLTWFPHLIPRPPLIYIFLNACLVTGIKFTLFYVQSYINKNIRQCSSLNIKSTRQMRNDNLFNQKDWQSSQLVTQVTCSWVI